MSNLILRILSGIVYVALMVGCLYYTEPAFAILITVLCLLSLMEAIDLTQKEAGGSVKMTALVYAGLIAYLTLFEQVDELSHHYAIAMGIQWVAAFFIWKSFKSERMPSLLFNTLYIWLPLASLAMWVVQHVDMAFKPVLFFFVVIWAYDSLAYVVGMLIGKRPIFPTISPKKTYEGTIGGVILTMTLAYFANAYYFQLEGHVLLYAGVIIFFGVFGDLFQSYFKRKIGVKDSGNLMPGHGGILDRLDSILLAVLPYILLLTLYY